MFKSHKVFHVSFSLLFMSYKFRMVQFNASLYTVLFSSRFICFVWCPQRRCTLLVVGNMTYIVLIIFKELHSTWRSVTYSWHSISSGFTSTESTNPQIENYLEKIPQKQNFNSREGNDFHIVYIVLGLSELGASGKGIATNAGDNRCEFDSWVRQILGGRKWQPVPVFLQIYG